MTRRVVLAVLALVPALLSGCALLPGASGGTGGNGGSAVAAPTGPSWIVASQGSAAPSARPSYGTASPTPGPTGGFLPLDAAAPTRTPISTCSPNTFNFSRIALLEVAPGPRSAVLSWYNVGGYNLVEFRLHATSQVLTRAGQRDVGLVRVKPGTPCGRMSATIGNLDRATEYVFSVDAVVLRRSGDGTHAATVARSYPIATK